MQSPMASRVEALRRAATVFGGVYFGLFVAQVVHWVTGLEHVGLAMLAVVLAGIGATAGWANSRDLTPLTDQERRDSVIGWSFVVVLVGVCLVGYLVETWT
jgi:hypothetical protein